MLNKKHTLALAAMGLSLAFCLAACAPVPASRDASANASEKNNRQMEFVWSVNAECSTCHAAEQESMSDSSCIASFHAGASCASCHDDAESLSEAHAKVTAEDTDGAKKLRKTKVSEEACLSCHSDDYVPEKTADVTALTDSEGTVVNPHELPDGSGHADIVCADCHSMHEGKASEDQAKEYCISCHHANVYECKTCHE